MNRADKRWFSTDGRAPIVGFPMNAAVIIIFVLGIGNFTLHRAVMESGHPLLSAWPGFARPMGRRIAFGTEFLVLLLALLLAANGWPGFAYAYGVYTACNALASWLMLSGRV
jgi:hypothetical protein